ncbi:MAG: glycoside hydrolase family 31 protein, partial [Acidobacteria bacterium]|nr:glycoside hydrolase family 31 protein [Acidobacteriota bacterium]
VKQFWGTPVAVLSGDWQSQTVQAGGIRVQASPNPLTFTLEDPVGRTVQSLTIAPQTGMVEFETGESPILGLGEGGAQFDRRGSLDRMISGQAGYQLRTHGGRVPIPWVIGTAGWAMFFHQPYGSFDFRDRRSRFHPENTEPGSSLDIFFLLSSDPATIMAEYSRLTGYPELPPLWSFGYQQSHRTLASPEEVIQEADTFRQKKLPCDAMIYLGTGFCPSGWNVENGSFAWNSRVFPKPEEALAALHNRNFHVVLHAVILSDKLRGTIHDKCDLAQFDEEEASCYWDAHRKDFAMGVDGWWPDEGDSLDITSRLVRNRMYWEGPQTDRINTRPYALHRNGYAGMQRYASFLWSGDVYSTWETLRTQVAVGINTGLSGVPYWGTDIGGFVPTPEFTAELYVRWFQFGAFCPLFRAHGRTWKLRLPWGWNTGDPGPIEIAKYEGAATPDASQLHNSAIEPICRKYLELRYRMLPYLYSQVHESTTTGMPIMRALWLHYPHDPIATACSDQYLWGPALLVAPVVEKGAVTRKLYLPTGTWYDFWTGERLDGGRYLTRTVDLETIPLYMRAGSIFPLGPVKQYVSEIVDQSLALTIYPGLDAKFLLYEDDGISFNYRRGEWTGIEIEWKDSSHSLTLSPAAGSRLLPSMKRVIEVRIGPVSRKVVFDGTLTRLDF